MILDCSLNNSLIFLPEGHILKCQMVHMPQQNSAFSPPPCLDSLQTLSFHPEKIFMRICLALSQISHLALKQGGEGSAGGIISHKFKCRDQRHREIQWLAESTQHRHIECRLKSSPCDAYPVSSPLQQRTPLTLFSTKLSHYIKILNSTIRLNQVLCLSSRHMPMYAGRKSIPWNSSLLICQGQQNSNPWPLMSIC